MKAAVILGCVLLVAAEARLLKSRAQTPISEKVIIGEGPSQYQFVGSEITFNQCYPYEVNKFGKIKVCGAGTVVKIYLRGRCEAYSHYVEEVGHCTGAVAVDPVSGEGDCMEVSPDSNKWLKAAQSYVIEQCGAATGQANDYRARLARPWTSAPRSQRRKRLLRSRRRMRTRRSRPSAWSGPADVIGS